MLYIRVKFENGETEEFSFSKQSVLLGRASSNDLHLDVDQMSRNHALIRVEGSRVIIEDLDSTNGTFIANERITSRELSASDVVRIGSTFLSAEYRLAGDSQDGKPSKELPSSEPPKTSKAAAIEILGQVESPAMSLKDVSGPVKNSGDTFYWESLKNFLQPVWPFIEDESVSEIMINGPDEIYIERKGELSSTDAVFTPDQLSAAVLNIAQYVGRRADENEPYLDARLPDGSRVAVLLPPCSRRGISIAIRKFSQEKLTLDKLIEFGSLSREMVVFLEACVVLKKNIIISGGTSSGKTSLLNVISGLIPQGERIITIEDSAELQLEQEHVLPMESKPPDKKGRGEMTIRDLLRASLRMRPDRIIVGEIRGGEALDLLQAMNTGHSGSKATVHASSPLQALSRLETLALFSGLEIPAQALRDQVSSAIEIVVQASRLPDHSRKITHISQVLPIASDRSYQVEDIFRFVHSETKNGKIIGSHELTGVKPTLLDEMKIAGLGEAVALFER
jgi:pilus assembly protein CpaF